ncbi:hypothetical protein GIB67_040795 [Kingdonia uniflora]|uniref:Pectinesterase n=1 Tax=Kingdonia uniflora TaxID=39325 RepID=A0A7J7P4V4_9MAGN|nr:hypothetical protein GIB67_040795 [Kingdonia uniflora]
MAGKMSNIIFPATFLMATLFVLLFPLVPAALDPLLEAAEKNWRVIKVRQNGRGEFTTVRDALNSVPLWNTRRTIIWIGKGTYYEKIKVDRRKPFVMFYGSKNNYPILTYNARAAQYGTFNSASVIIESDYFMAANIIFENSSPEPDGTSLEGGQAVALRISGDKASFDNCRFIGYQDTLCDDKGYHLFKNCYIEGTIDFIFGDGRSLYLNTELHSKAKGLSAITAQARDAPNDESGFTFLYCNITGTGNTYLGRAWKERARVVFAYSYMGRAVNPEGWSDHGYGNRGQTVFYGEYKCSGPGSTTNNRAKYTRILSDEEIFHYMMDQKMAYISIPAIFLTTTLLVLLFPLVPAALDANLQAAEEDVIKIRVRKDGSGDFKTISDAVKTVPRKNTKRHIISIGSGTYKEKVKVEYLQHFVTFVGSAGNPPVISYDDTSKKSGTFNSATVIVESDYFVASNIIFENTAPEPSGKEKMGEQAVAMRISGNKAAFYDCKFKGFQDTLCDDKGNHYFKNCYIEGTIDFVFGNGLTFYERCELHSLAKGLGAITANARDSSNENSGFVFVHCKITGTGDIYLGRAWKSRPKVVFAYTEMAGGVNSEGWSDKGYSNRDKTIFYGEYECVGPGASTTKRAKYAKILTADQVKPFLHLSYVGGETWILPPPKA